MQRPLRIGARGPADVIKRAVALILGEPEIGVLGEKIIAIAAELLFQQMAAE